MPEISVIIPAYNNEKYIAETIISLQKQTFKNFEVIIVNDGSVDNTQKIIDSFDDERIKSFIQENAGVSAARNRGINEATGKYVCFLDADDLYEPYSLEGFYKCAQENDADLVLGRIKRFDEYGEYVNEHAEAFANQEHIDNFDKGLLWNLLVSNKFYKREKLIEFSSSFPALRYAEETPFFLEFIYHKNVKICGTKNSTMRYRKHSDAVSQSVKPYLVADYVSALNSVYESAKNAGANENYLQEIIYKKAQILISQFYRFFWRADDESLSEIENGLKGALSDLSRENLSKLKGLNFDLDFDNLIFDRKEMAENPRVSVVIKNVNDELINSVFTQLYPQFEILVPKNSEIPDRWKTSENLIFVDGKNFRKFARSDMIYLNGKHINEHLLRQFVRVKEKIKIPPSILSLLIKFYFKVLK